jgi:hypothetical protein
MKQIAASLVKAQKAFGPALKTSSNPHFKSRYADLAACVEAVVDSLNANGIMLMQQSHECESGVIVETVFIHESGETMSSGKLHVPAQKNDPQGYGSALTYARRYSLMAACGIAPEDDDGNAASRPAKVAAIKPASAGSVAKNVWDGLSPDEQRYLDSVAIEVMRLMGEGQTGKALDYLASKGLDQDEKVAIFSRFPSDMRAAMKEYTKNAALADSIAAQA